MYKVIKHFTDMQDGNHPYNVGDTFPREGAKVLASRYKELASSKNRQGCPLIEEVEDEKSEKPLKTDKE
jgi:hypothetical protein